MSKYKEMMRKLRPRQEIRVKPCPCGCSQVEWCIRDGAVHVICDCCQEELAIITYYREPSK